MSRSFIDWVVEFDIKDMQALRFKARDLETWGKFDSARKLTDWLDRFNECVKDEWDEETSFQPIPVFPPYFEGEFDIDMNGWYHEWELPDGYEPETYYAELDDDGGLSER